MSQIDATDPILRRATYIAPEQPADEQLYRFYERERAEGTAFARGLLYAVPICIITWSAIGVAVWAATGMLNR